MVSKIKYIGILLLTIGVGMKYQHLGLGPINGTIFFNLGCIAIVIYCIAKLIGK